MIPGRRSARLRISLLLLLTGLVAFAARTAFTAEDFRDARLMRFPDIHGDTIVFSHAGDLWTVAAAGGEARRLTAGDGLELFPRFSPDGRWIAFTAQYDGTCDVYVIPAAGGSPRRLTWYPSRVTTDRMGWDNMVIGWTPEGKILFRSQRGPIGGFVGEPYVVSPEGGPVERFPLPESGIISFSPDGSRIAYNRIFRNFRTWKRYRGGMAQDIWIHDLQKGSIHRITKWEGTDSYPMWIEGSIFFSSDREDGRVNLWRYDLDTRKTSRVTSFRDHDVCWPHAGTGRIVFEQGGALYVLDPPAGEPVRVRVGIPDDRRHARRRWAGVQDFITEIGLAPGGRRALLVARGDVFTVPAERGDTRNATATPGARERGASWSPDGRWIACICDATGEEEIVLLPQPEGPRVELTQGSDTWHFPPAWSPDSRRLAWADRRMRLWQMDIQERRPVLVDTAEFWEISQYAWSPDSRWIAYAKAIENNVPTIFLYSLDGGGVTQVTSGVERCGEPAFDPEGRYLFFLSDRDIHPVLGNFELSFTVRRMTRPYALVLRSDLPSPLAPRSDEAIPVGTAPAAGAGGPGGAAAATPFRIDLDGIQRRIVGFPVPAGEYHHLRAARGKLFYVSSPVLGMGEDGGSVRSSLHAYDLESRKSAQVLASVDAYDISPDGTRLVHRDGKTFGIVEAKEGAKAEDGRLDLGGLKAELDPVAEWAQIFREAWRLQRDFFYLEDMGKIDWVEVRSRYEALLPHVSHRYDLTYVLGEMIGELATGHTYVGGGDYPTPERVPVGLLGADLELDGEAGRWRFARILEGQNWDESRRSPLTEPGIDVAAGEFLLAVDGKELTGRDEPYRLLVQGVGRTVKLLVSSRPTVEGARTVVVRPIASEAELRYHDWVEANRRKVEEATEGRVGYIHIPDMQSRGLREFIRQYFPQVRKEGLIVDVRYNGGGFVSQIILERLRRILVGMSAPREARPDTVPDAAFNGPMVALLNQYSASDGDLFPHYFRKYGLGPLIGRRSWGGVVGIRGIGDLVDGGYVTVPEFGNYGMESEWIIENEGVAPDIEVDNLPREEMEGRDAQLQRAIEEIIRRVEERRPSFPPRPPSRDLRPPARRGEPRPF